MADAPGPDAAAGESAPLASAKAVDPAYGGSWFAHAGTAVAARPALTQDLDVDVCVIGAGLAGLTTALGLARRGWSVAVLERARVAWNASSRNTGFVRPGFAQDVDAIVTRVGADHARELWTLSQGGTDAVRRLADEIGIDGVVQSEGWLHVSKRDMPREISDRADLLRSFDADIEYWPAKLVRTKLKSPYYFQAIHFPAAFNIDPYGYAVGLAQLVEASGVRIFEGTAAVSIDPAGVRKRVITGSGRVRAAHIVFAGNVDLGPIMPEVENTLIPLHTFAIVTKPLGENLASAIDYRGGVSDTDFADHHYRVVDGDRLLFAGRIATKDANPQRYGRKLRADLQRKFPQLGPVEIERCWSGCIGMTVHGMPQVGQLAPGVWLASGFAGHGLNTTAMAATLITAAIAESDDRYRLFEPFELIWSGGRLGRMFAGGFYAAHRRYERWASRRARTKELWWVAHGPRVIKERDDLAENPRTWAEEAAIAEAARNEKQRLDAEQAEQRRIERERIAAEKAEAQRIRAEERAAAKAEAARQKAERQAAARAEKQRIAAEKADLARREAERAAAERADAERIEAAHRNAERVAANAATLAAGAARASAAEEPVSDTSPDASQRRERD